MRMKPCFLSPPTFRDYDDYVMGCEYTKGWNDAMAFIFPEEAKKREREKIKSQMKIVKKDGEQE